MAAMPLSSPRPENVTIGVLARLTDVGVETLRFYEREGLLAQPHRPSRGYRHYPPEAVAQVRFIRRAKALGFTLEEIRELLALRAQPGVACGAVREQALAKVADIDRKLQELGQLREAVAALAQACRGDMPMRQCSILEALDEPSTDPPPVGADKPKRALSRAR